MKVKDIVVPFEAILHHVVEQKKMTWGRKGNCGVFHSQKDKKLRAFYSHWVTLYHVLNQGQEHLRVSLTLFLAASLSNLSNCQSTCTMDCSTRGITQQDCDSNALTFSPATYLKDK